MHVSLLLATQMPTFFAGLLLGIVLLVIGLVVGRRMPAKEKNSAPGSTARSERDDSGRIDAEHVLQMLSRLGEWTDNVATDVSHYKTEVGGLAEQCVEVETKDVPTQRASLVAILTKIVDANDNVQRRLEAAEQALAIQSNEIAAHMTEARTDALTRLPNRRAFDEEISRRMAQWRREKITFSVLMADVDYFKKINDRYGHQAGDAVLAQVAQRLQGSLRDADFVARYGGEEFAVLLPNQRIEDARVAAERIREAVCKLPPVHHQGQEIPVTISCGLAHVQADEQPGDLIKRADAALYAAKHAGRDRSFWHDGRQIEPIAGTPSPFCSTTKAAAEPRIESEFDRLKDDLRRRLEEVASEV